MRLCPPSRPIPAPFVAFALAVLALAPGCEGKIGAPVTDMPEVAPGGPQAPLPSDSEPGGGGAAPDPTHSSRPDPTTTPDAGLPPESGGATGGAGGAPPSTDEPSTITGSCDLDLVEVAAYQAVKIPLARDGEVVAFRNADVIQRRPAVFRVFARAKPGWGKREAEVRLTIGVPDGTSLVLRDRRTIEADSRDEVGGSTFNFDVPASAITEGSTFFAELIGPTSCTTRSGATKLPAAGPGTLRPRRTGVVKVRLVPIAYGADGSNRLPDTSEAQLKKFRDHLMAVYPVEGVELSVRPAVKATIKLGASEGWPQLLDALRGRREQDAPPADVYYHGLVMPAADVASYCAAGCTAGIAYVAAADGAAVRVGLGIGYGGLPAIETLAHELGHQHGRKHAPCGNPREVDASFPYANGGVGAWGFDSRTRVLLAPEPRKDMMGYCSPSWISDYTYQALAIRSSLVNVGAPLLAAQIGVDETPEPWWVMLVDGQGRASWGLSQREANAPTGRAERARVYDASGALVATPTVYRTDLSDEAGASILVPPPRAGWARIEVDGASPLDYAAPSSVAPLE